MQIFVFIPEARRVLLVLLLFSLCDRLRLHQCDRRHRNNSSEGGKDRGKGAAGVPA